MMVLISNLSDRLQVWLKQLKTEKLIATLLATFILLTTTNAYPKSDNQALVQQIREQVHQIDQTDKPKTTGEWNQEARETEGKPGKRLERIAKESGEALKQFGSGYVEGAKETVRDLQN
jgi:hypothetical protein